MNAPNFDVIDTANLAEITGGNRRPTAASGGKRNGGLKRFWNGSILEPIAKPSVSDALAGRNGTYNGRSPFGSNGSILEPLAKP